MNAPASEAMLRPNTIKMIPWRVSAGLCPFGDTLDRDHPADVVVGEEFDDFLVGYIRIDRHDQAVGTRPKPAQNPPGPASILVKASVISRSPHHVPGDPCR